MRLGVTVGQRTLFAFMETPLSPRSSPSHHPPPVHNRIGALMAHTMRYAFRGESRLADDAGISRAALNRLVHGTSSPSFVHVVALTQALEKALDCSLDPREVVSLDGTYPTTSVCELCGCRGCLPAHAYDEDDRIKAEFRDVKPGRWS